MSHLRAGPDNLPLGSDEVVVAPTPVRPVLPEGVHLTRRMLEALWLYGRFRSQKVAAHEMGIDLQTFKNLLYESYKELEVPGFLEAFIKLGWLEWKSKP